MRKHLVALLSVFGLAGSTLPAQSQVLKGSKPPAKTVETQHKLDKTASESKAIKNDADLKLRKSGQEANAASSKAQLKLDKADSKLTLKQKTVGNATGVQKTGNAALTKGNQAITKGNQQITKGNQQITKGNQQITKGNQAITKDKQ